MQPDMMNEAAVAVLAPNAAALQNARALSGGFASLGRTEDMTLLFGECPGSGKQTYAVSADLTDPASPVFRCSCPSRQLPCKHALGLLLAYARMPELFKTAPIPGDIARRREQKSRKPAGKQTAPPSPKTNLNAAAKKAAAQITGLERALKMAQALLTEGFGVQTAKTLLAYREQNVSLGDYYIPGVQTAFLRILQLLENGGDGERRTALTELAVFSALCKKSIEYFERKKAVPDVMDAALESYCGRVWQLKELIGLGYMRENARLIQLRFTSEDDEAAQELLETGLWLDLNSGMFYKTVNPRPYKALRHTKEEDSFHGILSVPRLAAYPLGLRARWEQAVVSGVTPEDIEALLALAEEGLSGPVKRLGEQARNPLGLRRIPALVRFETLECGENGRLWLRDSAGKQMELHGGADVDLNVLRFAFNGERVMALELSVLPDGAARAVPLALAGRHGLVRLGG